MSALPNLDVAKGSGLAKVPPETKTKLARINAARDALTEGQQ